MRQGEERRGDREGESGVEGDTVILSLRFPVGGSCAAVSEFCFEHFFCFCKTVKTFGWCSPAIGWCIPLRQRRWVMAISTIWEGESISACAQVRCFSLGTIHLYRLRCCQGI